MRQKKEEEKRSEREGKQMEHTVNAFLKTACRAFECYAQESSVVWSSTPGKMGSHPPPSSYPPLHLPSEGGVRRRKKRSGPQSPRQLTSSPSEELAKALTILVLTAAVPMSALLVAWVLYYRNDRAPLTSESMKKE